MKPIWFPHFFFIGIWNYPDIRCQWKHVAWSWEGWCKWQQDSSTLSLVSNNLSKVGPKTPMGKAGLGQVVKTSAVLHRFHFISTYTRAKWAKESKRGKYLNGVMEMFLILVGCGLQERKHLSKLYKQHIWDLYILLYVNYTSVLNVNLSLIKPPYLTTNLQNTEACYTTPQGHN